MKVFKVFNIVFNFVKLFNIVIGIYNYGSESFERFIERYFYEDDDGLFNVDEVKNLFFQFKYWYFLNSNREKIFIEVCRMFVKLEVYEDIFFLFVILVQVFLIILVVFLCFVKGDFQYKIEFIEF